MSTNKKIPVWIYIFAVISILSSAVGVYGGYVDASFFYPEFASADWGSGLIKHLGGMWASKNLAIILILVYGLIKKDFRWLAAIFLFKGISDTVDILYVNTSFREGSAGGFLPNLLNWLILALPGLLAGIYLLKRAKAEE